MRKLVGQDVFTVARIIKKSGLKHTLEALSGITSTNTDYTKVGINVFISVIEACANEGVDQEVFAFLEDILEVPNTSKMDLFELINLIQMYAKENDLKRFLSLVVGTTA